ncbi:MAG: MFS transporter [Candidatus Heimdallarchaeota archaeon]|nr:MFS transporter [Candidatus Heimdallarchaeota archaeon]
MSFSAALLLQYFQSKAQFFYIVELGLSPTYYALAIGIWAIYNSINDPLAGWAMDQKRTRWGRRVPWIIIFWLPLGISFGFLWTIPESVYSNEMKLFLWLILFLILFDTGYTVVILAWTALFPEMYRKTEDRNIVSAIRQIFSLVALAVALVLPPFFVHDGDIPSYGFFGWFLAGISIINIGISILGCKESHIETITDTEKYSLRDGLQIVLTNRDYQAFLVANLITYFAYGQVLAMLPFYRKFVLLEDEGFESLAYAAAIGITIMTLFFWVRLTNRSSPKYTFLVSATVFGLSLIPLWILDSPTSVILVMGVLGFGLGGLLMVVDLLIADVIDQDYNDTGKRREGIYFGFNGFFIRIAILMQAISLAIVSSLTGFDEDKDVQDKLGQTGIKIQMIVLPIIAFSIAIFVIKRYYSLEGEKLKQLKIAVQVD